MPEPSNRYGLTAARTHEVGRAVRLPSLTVYSHSHVFIPAAAEAVRPHLRPDPRAAAYTEDTRILTARQNQDQFG